MSTDTYAAAKKKSPAKTTKKGGGGGGGDAVNPEEANSRFARALGDLAMALGTYVYVEGGNTTTRTKTAKTAKTAKTTKKSSGGGGY